MPLTLHNNNLTYKHRDRHSGRGSGKVRKAIRGEHGERGIVGRANADNMGMNAEANTRKIARKHDGGHDEKIDI